MLAEKGGGRIIRSFCNRDVVSAHSNALRALQLHCMQTASIRVLGGKYSFIGKLG